jgi:hypothetical protein
MTTTPPNTAAAARLTQTDLMYGPLRLPADKPAPGRAPGGYHQNTNNQNSGERVQTLAETKGAAALIGPQGPLFWAGVFIVGFLVVNASARKG